MESAEKNLYVVDFITYNYRVNTNLIDEIFCPRGPISINSPKKCVILSKNSSLEYTAWNMNDILSGTLIYSSDFTNDGYQGKVVSVLYVISNGIIRKPTEKEQQGELNLPKIIERKEYISRSKEIINLIPTEISDKEPDIQLIKNQLYPE